MKYSQQSPRKQRKLYPFNITKQIKSNETIIVQKQKIIINEQLLNKKITFIKRYFNEVHKSFVFFGNYTNFDLKDMQKQIYQNVFANKQANYFIDETSNYQKINHSNEIFNQIKQINKQKYGSILNLNHNKPQQTKQNEKQPHNQQNYHYYGQLQRFGQQMISYIKHGYGLQINFIQNQNQLKQYIHFYQGYFINDLKHGWGIQIKQSIQDQTIQIYIGIFSNGNYDDQYGLQLIRQYTIQNGLNQKQSLQESQINRNNSYIYQHNSNIYQNNSQINQNQSIQDSKQQYKMANDHPTNVNRQKIKNQQRYYGGFISGHKNGIGILTTPSYQYQGQWSFNKPQGLGSLSNDLSYYHGYFKAGLKHGQGKQTFKNGDFYQGNYHNNKPSGHGKYTWKTGAFYQGLFFNGLRNGKGFWKHNDQSYQGQYVNDSKSGQGLYIWKNGTTFYKGSFNQDLRNGYGQMTIQTSNKATVYQGNWKNGFQQGYGQIYTFNHETKQLQIIQKAQFQDGLITKLLEKISMQQNNQENKIKQNINTKVNTLQSIKQEKGIKKRNSLQIRDKSFEKQKNSQNKYNITRLSQNSSQKRPKNVTPLKLVGNKRYQVKKLQAKQQKLEQNAKFYHSNEKYRFPGSSYLIKNVQKKQNVSLSSANIKQKKKSDISLAFLKDDKSIKNIQIDRSLKDKKVQNLPTLNIVNKLQNLQLQSSESDLNELLPIVWNNFNLRKSKQRKHRISSLFPSSN